MACSNKQKGDACFKGKLAGQCPVHKERKVMVESVLNKIQKA